MTDHLKPNRGLILSRALAASAAGLLPVPIVDELLADAIRGTLLRRLAEIRGVDVDEGAIAELAKGGGGGLLSLASVGAIFAGTRRELRRIAASLLLLRRLDDAIATWQLGTLFDHYCARHHLGLGLDGERARALQRAIDRAIPEARSEMVRRAFARGLKASGTIALLAPRAAYGLWSRRRGRPIDAEAIVPGPTLDRAPAGLVRRAAHAISVELAGVERGYLDALTRAFDAAFAESDAKGR